jgi:hypothetical protein
MTPEGRVKEKVKEVIKAYKPHVYAHWPVMNGMGAPTLDCVGCANGEFFAVETKAEGKDLTPRQRVTQEEMRKAGARVFVIVGVDDIELKAFDAWLHKRVMNALSRGG